MSAFCDDSGQGNSKPWPLGFQIGDPIILVGKAKIAMPVIRMRGEAGHLARFSRAPSIVTGCSHEAGRTSCHRTGSGGVALVHSSAQPVFEKGCIRARKIDNATTGFAGRETSPIPPPFRRTVAATLFGRSSSQAHRYPAEASLTTMPVSASAHLRRSRSSWRRHPRITGRGHIELSPFSGLPNKTSISKPVKGGKLTGTTSGRSAP